MYIVLISDKYIFSYCMLVIFLVSTECVFCNGSTHTSDICANYDKEFWFHINPVVCLLLYESNANIPNNSVFIQSNFSMLYYLMLFESITIISSYSVFILCYVCILLYLLSSFESSASISSSSFLIPSYVSVFIIKFLLVILMFHKELGSLVL